MRFHLISSCLGLLMLALAGCAEPAARAPNPGGQGGGDSAGDAAGDPSFGDIPGDTIPGDTIPGDTAQGDSNPGDASGDPLPPGDTPPPVDCYSVPALGAWTGTFVGTIDGGMLGMLDVNGTVNMDLNCDGLKVNVGGILDGQGCATGTPDCMPYTANILGEYDPVSETIAADVDGSVDTGTGFVVPFAGVLDGRFTAGPPDSLDGTWSGQSVPPAPAATGAGTWQAGRL